MAACVNSNLRTNKFYLSLSFVDCSHNYSPFPTVPRAVPREQKLRLSCKCGVGNITFTNYFGPRPLAMLVGTNGICDTKHLDLNVWIETSKCISYSFLFQLLLHASELW